MKFCGSDKHSPRCYYFINRKIKKLEKTKPVSFMRLTVKTAKHSSSVNPNGLCNCVEINANCSVRYYNSERNKTEEHRWEAGHNSSWDQRKIVEKTG